MSAPHAAPPPGRPPATVPAASSASLLPPPPPPPAPSLSRHSSARAPPHSMLSVTTVHAAASRQSSTVSLVEPHKPPARACVRLVAHTLDEAGDSLWISTRLLLVIRLCIVAYLLSHTVFFTLHDDLDYRLYNAWTYVLHMSVVMVAVFCSLLHLIQDDEESVGSEEDPHPPMPTSLPSRLGSFLAAVCVPAYHVSLTVVATSAVLQWAFIQTGALDYPALSMHVVLPVVAFMDAVLSANMRFRLVYIALVVVFNGVYGFVLYLFNKQGEPLYEFLDPAQPRGEFIAKIVGISAGSILAAVLIYLLSYIPTLSCLRKEEVNVSDESCTSSDTLSPAASPVALVEKQDVHRLDDLGSVTALEEDMDDGVDRECISSREADTRDRSSLPLLRSSSGKAFLSRIAPSRSTSSIGEDERMMRMVRNDSRASTWSADMEVAPKIDEEFFRMPAAYTGSEDEIVRLARVGSARVDSGGLARSTSWRLSAASSLKSLGGASGTGGSRGSNGV